jgi:hypothetical protein
MVTDPAHELAKIRLVLERIASALESLAGKTDPGFATAPDQHGREAERPVK